MAPIIHQPEPTAKHHFCDPPRLRARSVVAELVATSPLPGASLPLGTIWKCPDCDRHWHVTLQHSAASGCLESEWSRVRPWHLKLQRIIKENQ